MVSGPRDTPRRVRASHTATPCSTASSQNRDADWPVPNGAESSFRPSRECTRSIGSNGRRQSIAPAPQHRVDFRNHLADGAGPMAAEYLLEHAQERRPLVSPRGAKRHPSVSPTANPTEVKAEKSEALALRQVHPPSLLLVHFDLERRQFLTESSFDRRSQPVLSRVRVYEDHEWSGALARWCPGAPWPCPPFPASCPSRRHHHSVSNACRSPKGRPDVVGTISSKSSRSSNAVSRRPSIGFLTQTGLGGRSSRRAPASRRASCRRPTRPVGRSGDASRPLPA